MMLSSFGNDHKLHREDNTLFSGCCDSYDSCNGRDSKNPLVVLETGVTATGKTTTSRRLEDFFKQADMKALRLSTSEIRKELFPDVVVNAGYFDQGNEEAKKQRDTTVAVEYLRTLRALKGGFDVVILDSSHTQFYKRRQFYELEQENLANVVVVNCVCENEELIRQRIKRRYFDPLKPENEAKIFETYQIMKEQADNLLEDRYPINERMCRPNIIRYDSEFQTVQFMHLPSEAAEKMTGKIRGVYDLLHKFYTPERQEVYQVH